MPFSSTSGPMPTPLLGERTLRLESEIAFIFRSSSVRRANLKRPRGFRHAIYEWVARFQVPPPLVVQSADNDAVGRPAGDPWLNVTPNASTPSDLLLVLNAHHDLVEFTLPAQPGGPDLASAHRHERPGHRCGPLSDQGAVARRGSSTHQQ